MKYLITDSGPGEKLITVTVPVVELEPYLDKASKSLTEQKDIDGWRRGKAPRPVVEKKFGTMAVLERAVDDIVNTTYYQILKADEILTIGSPQIDFKKIVPGNDLEYTAKITLIPKVEIGDIEKIKVTKPEVNVEDKDVDAVVEDLQKMRAKEVVVDREAKKGDKVEIDFAVKIDGVIIEEGAGKKYPLILGDGMFIPGFEEKVVGMKRGETKMFKLTFPDDYKAELKGQEADFEVKRLSVFGRQLPDINDDLARQAGDYKTLADLKKQIRSNLEIDSKARTEQEWEVKILEKLIEKSSFSPIPAVLIDNEIHRMMHELEDNLSQQGIKVDQYLARLGKTKKDLATEWQETAQARVKTALLARQLANDKKIEASEQEIEKEKQKMLAAYQDKPQIKTSIESQDFHDYLFHSLTNRRVIDYLKKKVGD